MNKMQYVHCEHKPKKLFSINRVNYYGADLQGSNAFKGDLIVNLSGHARTFTVEKISSLVPYLAYSNSKKIEEISIPWVDFSSPPVKAGFWKALHQHVLSKGYKSVCFHCYGGHGRTGTALASMLIENLEAEPMGALRYIREKYCVQAVETDDQIRYLKSLYEKNFPIDYNIQDEEEESFIQDDSEMSEGDALDLGTKKYNKIIK